jgi:lipoprotein-releasing system ATP-binding protein
MSETAKPLVALEDVRKAYDAAANGAPLEVLRGVTLAVGPGASLAIVGPSGSGKSTLLNIMGTLDRPTSGRVVFQGRDLAAANDEELAEIRSRHVGFVFQLHHLLPQLTVYENALVPTLALRGAAAPREPHADRARRLLAAVGLAERQEHRPGQLSGGERQRAAVVRALINGPELLLADEPTGALDQASAEELMELLVRLNREEGVALVVVTHALALAGRLGRVFELRGGELRPREA